MKFPRNNKKLTEIFKNAEDVSINDFKGEYWVEMLTGIIPNLKNVFKHRKRFFTQDNTTAGYNMFFKNYIFGHFSIEEGTELDVPVIILNYNQKQNSCIFRRIKDKVRCIEKDKVYLGRLTYNLFGKFRFVGYFTLTKINDK